MKIGVLNGDHIGHEVAPEAVKVLPAAAAATGVPTQNSESQRNPGVSPAAFRDAGLSARRPDVLQSFA
jgi:isocitrate/isopropylmalate dehydrogenase